MDIYNSSLSSVPKMWSVYELLYAEHRSISICIHMYLLIRTDRYTHCTHVSSSVKLGAPANCYIYISICLDTYVCIYI